MASGRNERGRNNYRLLQKLNAALDARNYYEAHQLYRSLYFRFVGVNMYSEALDILYVGATILLQNDQAGSGADLAILYVDTLIKSQAPLSDVIFDNLGKLFAAIGPSVAERETFLTNAIKWSLGPAHKKGHPKLHAKIACALWKEKNYMAARQHFLLSADARNCAFLLIDIHRTKGYPSEIDLFIAQAVLQYLIVNNRLAATEVFKTYVENHPGLKIRRPPYKMPLLNFLSMLLQAIETKNTSAYKVLVEKYHPSLNRDPSYLTYLEKIGQLYLSLPSQPQTAPPANGMLQNLMQQLFTSLDTEESSNSTSSQAPPVPTMPAGFPPGFPPFFAQMAGNEAGGFQSIAAAAAAAMAQAFSPPSTSRNNRSSN